MFCMEAVVVNYYLLDRMWNDTQDMYLGVSEGISREKLTKRERPTFKDSKWPLPIGALI